MITPRTPRLDRERCKQLLASRSTNEMIAAPFRGQLRAALLELARTAAELDRTRAELDHSRRDYERIVPAADALLHETRAHSKECVCPMCRSVRGYREIILKRVAEYRLTRAGSGS